jgi:hypothetical protein
MWFAAVPAAEALDFPAAAIDDPAVLSKAMPTLARAAMAEFRNDDRRAYLDTLFRLQMAAGDDEGAIKSLIELRALNPSSLSPRPGAALFTYEILARARLEARRDALAPRHPLPATNWTRQPRSICTWTCASSGSTMC